MNLMTKAALLGHLGKWWWNWNRLETSYPSEMLGQGKFMTALEAVKLIPDGAVVATSGLAGNQRASVVFRAARELFLKTGHPKDVTLLCTGGQGGRGIVPGTLEEFALAGLCKHLITAHFDTFVKILRMAERDELELTCLPQGILTLLLDGQGKGENSLLSETGLGTFLDPRCGRGSILSGKNTKAFVTLEGEKLRYEIPAIDVAIFNAPAADREGNIYVKNCALVGESREIAHAARQNQGKVIANVGLLVEKGYDEVFLPASMVDAIVHYPETEQTASVPHRKYWSFFTPQSQIELGEGLHRIHFINQLLGITPRRNQIHALIARLATKILTQHCSKGTWINIGTGLPEEVSRFLYESGLWKDITLFTEGGAVGGIPASGVFFGAAVVPEKILPSVEIFKKCYEHLEVAVFGMLEADSEGNVNVSQKKPGFRHYVGPGGFMDLSTCAKNIVFVSSWMNHGKMKFDGMRMRILKRGKPKFLEHVSEVTFPGKRALAMGKNVFFVTDVGIFQLTPKGMKLIEVMPGIDIKKDMTDFSPMKFSLSPSLCTIAYTTLAGRGLAWKSAMTT